jgi:hypothetical protein
MSALELILTSNKSLLIINKPFQIQLWKVLDFFKHNFLDSSYRLNFVNYS